MVQAYSRQKPSTVGHRFSKCSVRSPRAPREKPRGSASCSFTYAFIFRNLLWGSVNYGQSLHGLHNTISLRTPAVGHYVCAYTRNTNLQLQSLPRIEDVCLLLFFLLLMLLFHSVCHHQVSNQADKLDLLALFIINQRFAHILMFIVLTCHFLHLPKHTSLADKLNKW